MRVGPGDNVTRSAIRLRGGLFRAPKLCSHFRTSMGASDAAFKLSDRGGTALLSSFLALLQTEALHARAVPLPLKLMACAGLFKTFGFFKS